MPEARTLIPPHEGAFYTHFIRDLLLKRRTKRYIEIGVRSGELLSMITADSIIGVDPNFVIDSNVLAGKNKAFFFQETSDEFFSRNIAESLLGGKPEVVFLDGMHTFEYLLRDFYNAEAICSPSSLIMIHDCLPLTAQMAQRSETVLQMPSEDERFARWWTGDVWKIIPILEKHRPDLRLTLIDCPPTGLVCISNLNPISVDLKKKYFEIVDAVHAQENSDSSIARFYEGRRFVRSRDVLNEMDNTLYFGI